MLINTKCKFLPASGSLSIKVVLPPTVDTQAAEYPADMTQVLPRVSRELADEPRGLGAPWCFDGGRHMRKQAPFLVAHFKGIPAVEDREGE